MPDKIINYPLIIIFFLVLIVSCEDTAELYGELWGAASVGNLEKVKQLVDKGLDVNKRDLSNSTALLHAATGGHTDVVKFLISKGAGINIKEKSMGLSPLSAAAGNGHKSTVIALLEAGATDIGGALIMAEQYRRNEIVKLLLDLKR